MKRFYKTAGTAPAANDARGGFHITLDGKPVRTPAKAHLVVPGEGLAAAIAAEWQAQGEVIDPRGMGLMTLACTTLDRVRPQRSMVVDEVLRFAGTDLLCYRATGPEKLVERQHRAWQPLLDWAAMEFDAPLRVTAGVMPVEQDEQSIRALGRAVERLDDFRLVVLHSVTSLTGSLVAGLALIHGRIDTATAWDISRIDADYQIEQWGADAEAEQVAANARAALETAGTLLSLLR
jgi:chaperone required for assembly of F1-ATPase